jgi:hypothetical protein
MSRQSLGKIQTKLSIPCEEISDSTPQDSNNI